MFKRRNPKTYLRWFGEFFYPPGGWRRSGRYIVYRLRRLPDPAHKISRGIAAGVFASFTPFFGLHFFTAAGIAYLMRGNILASLLATFFGNPVTFPIIATVAVELGTWMLNAPRVPPQDILLSFSVVSVELWGNFAAIFTPRQADWTQTSEFFSRIFLPYLVGGIVPGILTALAAYFMANPVIASYQKGRIARMKQRFEARRRKIEMQKASQERAEAAAKGGVEQ
ncbi:DUF2062 domain-containing protein [Ovoidimarina sediminis]|uniref:DUF2062 domain-containing protein n=1 Tax=Ovoidimarina sediminis TaxID=3079856 RepID=UPI002912996C|nr:DUF2062 domain-containing protein [Rhodophyticola sp. MJ-SS7]MDU8943920.1 DUF2062 domain-containing protein [Rhodophyticola sp. MJ-SS7]